MRKNGCCPDVKKKVSESCKRSQLRKDSDCDVGHIHVPESQNSLKPEIHHDCLQRFYQGPATCDPLKPLECCSNVCVGHFDKDGHPVYKEGTGQGHLQYICDGRPNPQKFDGIEASYLWSCDGGTGKGGKCMRKIPGIKTSDFSWAGGVVCQKGKSIGGRISIGGT